MTSKKHVNFGLLTEAPTDKEAVMIFAQRIAQTLGVICTFSKTPIADTGIIGVVKIHTKRFFFEQKPIDVAIYVTDQDKHPKTQAKLIKKMIESIDKNLLNVCAIGIPNPHIEIFLLGDQDVVKNVFKIDGKRSLPYLDRSPKERMNLYLSEMEEPKITKYEAWMFLASKADLNKLMKISNFKKFADSLKKAIKNHLES